MEKCIKRMMRKRSAKLTVELSIMIAIIVVAVIAVLVMFGSGLRDVVANSGIKNMLTAEKTEYNPFDRKYENIDIAKTQENIGAVGEQGITAKFDAEHPEEWINDVFATLLKKDPKILSAEDLEALARALAMANFANTEKIDDYNANCKKCENLGIEDDSDLGKVSYKYPIKDGIKKELNYKEVSNENGDENGNNNSQKINQFLYETAFEKAEN